MSIDRYLYVGYYLNIGKIKIEHLEPEVGCDNCKTSNSRDVFCGKCGIRHTEYDKKSTCRNLPDLLNLAYDREEIDGETHDLILESFDLQGEEIIPIDDCDAGVSHHVNYDFVKMDYPDIEEGDARDYFQPVVDLLNRYNISNDIKSGILFYTK